MVLCEKDTDVGIDPVLITVLTGAALADTSPQYGDSSGLFVVGHDQLDFSWTGSAYSCSTRGYSVIDETTISDPWELYIKLFAWDGDTFLDYRSATTRTFPSGMGAYYATVSPWGFPRPAANPHVIGYHRYTYEAGSILDECQIRSTHGDPHHRS